MKKAKVLVLAAMATSVMLLAGCSNGQAKLTDGTYEGTSDAGMHAGLKVEVTVAEGKISDVKVTEHQETEGIGTEAIDKIPGEIKEKQSTEIEVVSGATLTSNAIIEATNKALEGAK